MTVSRYGSYNGRGEAEGSLLGPHCRLGGREGEGRKDVLLDRSQMLFRRLQGPEEGWYLSHLQPSALRDLWHWLYCSRRALWWPRKRMIKALLCCVHQTCPQGKTWCLPERRTMDTAKGVRLCVCVRARMLVYTRASVPRHRQRKRSI
jgi:hypothetical protein